MTEINLSTRHVNIPVFIPEKSCPFRCIYCNQQSITGIKKTPSINEITTIIDNHLATIKDKNTTVEIAFFGGNFTGIPFAEQELMLSSVQQYIADKQVQSIRVSTRPDYINKKVLDLLKKYNVKTIELGIQSMDDEVLKISERGYTSDKVYESVAAINEYGFKLCLQMMVGLPGDTLEKSIETARAIINCGATMTRIYPLLVIKDTVLEALFNNGHYKPLSIEEAVFWSREIYKIFHSANVTVLKMGLHPSADLMNGSALISGPFHPSFAELVFTSIWNEKLSVMQPQPSKKLKIYINASDYNHAIGYQAINKIKLASQFKTVKFEVDNKLNRFEFYADYC